MSDERISQILFKLIDMTHRSQQIASIVSIALMATENHTQSSKARRIEQQQMNSKAHSREGI